MKIDILKEEIEILLSLAKQIKNESIEHYKELSKYIPERIRRRLEESWIDGHIHISLPSMEHTHIKNIQGLFLSWISELVSYEAECGGAIFQDIYPIKENERKQISTGSNVELEVHTEQAFSKWRPDYISLSCIRGASDAVTYLLDIKEIENGLSREDWNMLWLPLWTIGIDESFLSLSNNSHNIRGPMSILSELDGLVFDKDLMKGLTENAENLIEKITRIYNEKRVGYILQSGDILIIDNRRMIHGRSKFMPKYDGMDRWVIRCFGMRNLEKSKEVRKGRMILSRYS